VQEKKEEDSTSKYVSEVQRKAPPSLVDVVDLNKQFKTWTFVLEKD
jgi:DNA-binding protein H-NS